MVRLSVAWTVALLVLLSALPEARAQSSNQNQSGFAVCISGTTRDDYGQSINFQHRLCHIDSSGRKSCTPTANGQIQAAPKGKIPFGLYGAGWTRDYAARNNLQNANYWIEIIFDQSFAAGLQSKEYSLTPIFLWDLGDPLQCRRIDRRYYFHFRKKGNGLDLFQGCHAKDNDCN